MHTVMMPNGIFNKICDATVPALWMLLNEQLNCLKHLRRQLDGSISLVQCAKPATTVPAHVTLTRKAQIRLMKTKYGESIVRVNLLDSDSEFEYSRNHIIEEYTSLISSDLESDFYVILEYLGKVA